MFILVSLSLNVKNKIFKTYIYGHKHGGIGIFEIPFTLFLLLLIGMILTLYFLIRTIERKFNNLHPKSDLARLDKRNRVIVFQLIITILFFGFFYLYFFITRFVRFDLLIYIIFIPLVAIIIALIYFRYAIRQIHEIRYEYNKNQYIGFRIKSFAVVLLLVLIVLIGLFYFMFHFFSFGIILFSILLFGVIFFIGEWLSRRPVKYAVETRSDKILKSMLGLAIAIMGWFAAISTLNPGNFPFYLFSWDQGLAWFLFFFTVISSVFVIAIGLTIMIVYLAPVRRSVGYAHPELMKPTTDHLIFFTGIGSGKKGWVNAIIIRRFQQLAEKIMGKEVSNHYLEQASLPTRINIFKRYPLDAYILYIQALKKGMGLTNQDLHDTMVRNYYHNSSFGKMIQHINKKRIVDVIASTYQVLSNKGHLVIIKITDERAILNYYVETKYQDLLYVILGLYRVELNMYDKRSDVKVKELIRRGDAVCYRIVVNFLS